MSKRTSHPSRAAQENAPLFAALGDPTRLHLVQRLSNGEALSIARLHAGSSVTRQAITKHLQVLRAAGLVRGDQHGREHLWQLERERLDSARQCLDQISAQWDQALERLRTFVEL
jgi:DNA-binding transcriptional ArsR family regulator